MGRCHGPHPDGETTRLDFIEPFSASTDVEDVVIPPSDPVITGSGADLSKATIIGLHVAIPAGSTYTMDSIAASRTAVPEPSEIVLLTAGLAGLLVTRLVGNKAVRR